MFPFLLQYLEWPKRFDSQSAKSTIDDKRIYLNNPEFYTENCLVKLRWCVLQIRNPLILAVSWIKVLISFNEFQPFSIPSEFMETAIKYVCLLVNVNRSNVFWWQTTNLKLQTTINEWITRNLNRTHQYNGEEEKLTFPMLKKLKTIDNLWIRHMVHLVLKQNISEWNYPSPHTT